MNPNDHMLPSQDPRHVCHKPLPEPRSRPFLSSPRLTRTTTRLTRSTARLIFREYKMTIPGAWPGRCERQWRTKPGPNWIIPCDDAEPYLITQRTPQPASYETISP
ncbi:hypothetical protein FOWG_17613 [Fusarium oxysporum f. sp. lycopersici MN25]|nr:hypothetical protein FOWG_17613 [Fusarium oxysporum f. sp. lycopersici MN25]